MENKSDEAQAPDVQMLKAVAIRIAMTEIIAEQRAEIIRRAQARLEAQGVHITEADLKAES